jgi:hypothetical protein
MRPVILLSFVLLASGCSPRGATSPAAYLHFRDYFRASFGSVFGYPCTHLTREDGVDVYESTKPQDCYRFSAARRMRGVWIDEFEGSEFFEGATSRSAVSLKNNDQTWLELENHRPTGRAYFMDFIGRKTLVPGHYGHMGGSRNLVLINRVISVRPIGG